ncbi:hypothetical protein G6F47_006558 [Rhizopus delemar]|nr:hypothetical protein G6F54_009771 [Rhizopus delemar]KAG1506137.1 hypothetical protein G6F53_009910 [Rhizopus delemar]KAG1598287.1 hypothetical protein G6F47_006558 [Rhizopus delemar]
MSMPRLIGELAIVAYKAVAGKQDPFVIFRLGENTRQTRTDYRGGQHPLWDDQVNMPVPEKKKSMVVQVYDEDAKRKDLISELELDLTKVLEEGEHDDWFPLQYKGRKAGEIYLEMTFYSAAPPPKRQPTRYGTRPKKPVGHAPPVSSAATPQPYPYLPSSAQPVRPRPLPPVPIESQPPAHYPGQYTSTYPSSYPNAYPPVVPPHTISTVPVQSVSTGRPVDRPVSYAGPQPSAHHLNRPSSRPISTPSANGHLAGSTTHAPLLSSPYNPAAGSNSIPPQRPGYGYSPSTNGHGGYPSYPTNNRNSYPPQTTGHYPPYPPSNNQFHGYPKPSHSGSYAPQQVDSLGTPFAAHQGSYYPPNSNGQPYPPHHVAYPSQHSNNGYPPY